MTIALKTFFCELSFHNDTCLSLRLGVFGMMISGVGIISPLYASHIFSSIPGEKYKGYVSCVHFIALVLFVGYLLPPTRNSSSVDQNNGEVIDEKKKKLDEEGDKNMKITNDGLITAKSSRAKKTE